MKNAISRFGKFLSGMVMPNIGAFIAWGFLTALFIEKGWFPNERLSSMVSPMLSYLLPILIAGQGGYMVAKERGRVIACIAVIGCICGSDYTMLMGAMVMGPLAGWVIKQFDNRVEEHIPAGFEMLVHNFSIGILGMLLAILGYYVIGPFMTAILTVLTAGVDFLVSHSLLPLVSIFIEPAKVLFLNNAINHGISTQLASARLQRPAAPSCTCSRPIPVPVWAFCWRTACSARTRPHVSPLPARLSFTCSAVSTRFTSRTF